jgi:hypothetical protein
MQKTTSLTIYQLAIDQQEEWFSFLSRYQSYTQEIIHFIIHLATQAQPPKRQSQ